MWYQTYDSWEWAWPLRTVHVTNRIATRACVIRGWEHIACIQHSPPYYDVTVRAVVEVILSGSPHATVQATARIC